MRANPPGASAADLDRRFEATLALHRDGRLAEAEAGYRDILGLDPEHSDALLHLGVLALQAGQPEQAAASIRAALARNPTSAVAHCHLATALRLLQRSEEAIALYEAALGIDPDMAEAHYGLGNALHAAGRVDEAAACYQRAVAIDPDYAEAHFALAEAYQAQKLPIKAIGAYDAALEIDPSYAEAHCGRGRALQSQFRYADAISSYEKALAANPDYVEAHTSLGTTVQALDRHEDALQHFARALAIKPDHADALCRRGLALEELGRLDEARQALAQAIAIEPRNPHMYYLLANAKGLRPGDPQFAAMENLAIDMASFDADGQIHLHFALAKALGDAGDPAASFRHLVAGSALKRQQIVYDEAATIGLLDRIAALFTADFLRAHAGGGGDPTQAPIFIVGMPRSGSTLVEQVLAGHPRVAACGERADMRDCVLAAAKRPDASNFPEFVAYMSDAQLRDFGAAYRSRMAVAARTVRPTADRFTDKTLNNFCLIGLIRLALPRAKILHCRRDPVDTCLSCFSQLFGSELPYTYDLSELGRYYRHYAALMRHWSEVLPARAILEVSYERLVGDFDTEVRRLLDHCELDFDPACLAFHATQRPVRTASTVQIREPLNSRSIRRVCPEPDLLAQLTAALGA